MTKDQLEREYEAAVAANIAIGHEDEPDCECPVCDKERELYFIDKHFFDDAALVRSSGTTTHACPAYECALTEMTSRSKEAAQ